MGLHEGFSDRMALDTIRLVTENIYKIDKNPKDMKATIYRHIDTLCEEKYIIPTGTKKYIPGPKIRNIILNSFFFF